MIIKNWTELRSYDSYINKVVSSFMNRNDVKNMAIGRYELSDRCYVSVSEYETFKNFKFEAHRQYVDVQVMVSGEEEVFCAPLAYGTEQIPYQAEKDIAFYSCDKGPFSTIRLCVNQAIVLKPNDMHAPCNSKDVHMNRKLVFKIPTECVKKDK